MELVERYFAEVSNEPDGGKRRAGIEVLFDENVRYVDQDGPVEGREAFIARITELATLMGEGMRFTSRRPPQRAEEALLFSWALGRPGEEPVLVGTDVAIVADGRITRLYAVVE
ncbi:nuclear transport factor 2 family protein [Microbacterium sp.]|uniref:nuclear transport factor 2 family protein n=1 Tax=Microbacterium sp. TaxID=51671 RepID=UPI003C73B88D